MPPGGYSCGVRVLVDAQGIPESATATVCPDPFRDAAVAAAMASVYTPALDATGTPTRGTARVWLRFRLSNPAEHPRTRLGVSGGLAAFPPPERVHPLRGAELVGHVGVQLQARVVLEVAAGMRSGGLYVGAGVGRWTVTQPTFLVGARAGVVSTDASTSGYAFGAAPFGAGFVVGDRVCLSATLDPEIDVDAEGAQLRMTLSVGLGIALDPGPWRVDP